MADALTLLDAGAVLPLSTVDSERVDALTARSYRHSVLDRAVVRLVPETLGDADELSMEFLGFDRPTRIVRVGLVRRRALGFAGWVLIHDPAHARHALALVKDIERLTRLATTRVGLARNGFVALGERLAAATPHLLPPFYEEAARAFIETGNINHATAMFGRARDAERMHGLAVDEERVHTAYLEFALRGALTAKALAGYARDLAGRCAPSVAYERFSRLCVEWIRRGLPPYPTMHADLRRLAGAVAPPQDRSEFLASVLSAPALQRAPSAFWTEHRTGLIELARRDPAVRGQLLGAVPAHCPPGLWLDVLLESGADAALTDHPDSVPAAAHSPDGPDGWLCRFLETRPTTARRDPKLLSLVLRMVPRLLAEGTPITLPRQPDFDLLDLLLEHEVPLSPRAAGGGWAQPLSGWFDDPGSGRRDLLAVAANERFRRMLGRATARWLAGGLKPSDRLDAESLRAALAVPGLRLALHTWLDEQAEYLGSHGLGPLDEQTASLLPFASADMLAVNAPALERIAGFDIGATLGRTLRCGVLDEYGWPALDEAVGRLGGVVPCKPIRLTAQWPYLVVRRESHVFVVGPDRIELEHDARIPADERQWPAHAQLRYVDGQLLVWWRAGKLYSGYWSGTPDDVFTTDGTAFSRDSTDSLPLVGGGRTVGGVPLRAGDHGSQARVGPVSSDGRRYWVLVHSGHEATWHEYDPLTGALGTPNEPDFFRAHADPDAAFVPADSWLYPVAASARVGGPLAARDGVLGWRLHRSAAGTYGGETTGGARFALHRTPKARLLGAVRFPEADSCLGVLVRHNQTLLWADDGFEVGAYRTAHVDGPGPFARATPLVPPLPFWHYFTPRDPAGSTALRSVTDAQASRLATASVGLDIAGVARVVAEALPEVTHPRLLQGVAGIVQLAVQRAEQLGHLRQQLTGVGTESPVADTAPAAAPELVADGPAASFPDNETLLAAIGDVHPRPGSLSRGSGAVQFIAQVGAALIQDSATARIPRTASPAWLDLLDLVPVMMLRTASSSTSAKHRLALLAMLRALAESGLLASGLRLRRLVGRATQGVRGDHRLLVLQGQSALGGNSVLLQVAENGEFAAVPGFEIAIDQRFDGGISGEDLSAFLVAAERGEPYPVQPEYVERLSARAGMTRAEAALLLAGLPTNPGDGAEPAVLLSCVNGSAAALRTARETWAASPDRIGALRALLPAPPRRLFDDGPAIDACAAWWTDRVGPRGSVDDELVVLLERAVDLPAGMSASAVLHGLTSPDTWPPLRDAVTGPAPHDDRVWVALAMALPWLAYHLPAESPLRPRLAEAVAMARAHLRDPHLTLQVGRAGERQVKALLRRLGVASRIGPDGTTVAGAVELPPDHPEYRSILVRPARLTGPDDPTIPILVESVYFDEEILAAIQVLLGEHLTSLMAETAAMTATATSTGAAQDPTRSAPHLAAAVAEKHGLSPEAAALYLQILALPDPTDRNVARWTGWRPARLKAVRAELAATPLVVNGKRARAGRSLFLPGGWLALSTPNVPVERWKVPLLTIDHHGHAPLNVVVPLALPPRLFELAWARVEAGDAPRYETLSV